VSPAEVIARPQAATWQVAFDGFAPGFGYLAGDAELFDVPRRSSPRPPVPIGTVALAGAFTGVYPRSSPGGWQLIARTVASLRDLDRPRPALFGPGTIVRFADGDRDAVGLGARARGHGASGAASAAAVEARSAEAVEAGSSAAAETDSSAAVETDSSAAA